MSKRRRWCSFWGLILVLLVGAYASAAPFVNFVRGQVKLSYKGIEPVALQAGETLKPGAVIETGAESVVELALEPGASLRLAPQSILLWYGPQTKEGKEEYKLKRGLAYLETSTLDQPLFLKTERGVSEIQGGVAVEFESDDGVGTVRVYTGTVVYRLPGGGGLLEILLGGSSEVEVEAGHTSQTVGKMPPSEPKPFTPPDQPWFEDSRFYQGGARTPAPWETETSAQDTTQPSSSGEQSQSGQAGDTSTQGGVNLDEAFRGGGPFTGTWEGDFGKVVLLQRGDRVTGCYVWDKGRIEGRVEGDLLKGHWYEAPTYQGEDDSGDFELRLSEDNQTLHGHWRYGHSGDWDGNWSLRLQYSEPDYDVLPSLRALSEDQRKVIARLGEPNTFVCYYDDAEKTWYEIYGYYFTGRDGSVTGAFTPRLFYFKQGRFTRVRKLERPPQTALRPLLLSPDRFDTSWTPAQAKQIFGQPLASYARRSKALGEVVFYNFENGLFLGFKQGHLFSVQKGLLTGEVVR